MSEQQIDLFGNEDLRPKVKRPARGSQSSIVFHDYESFLAKFADNPKTTDDCFTPKDVYEAVVKYVGTVIDMSDKVVLRPFFPGGDYENAEYPENGVVIDNPPFSLFTKICAFYAARDIPFFLFGNGMTITRCLKYATAIIINGSITFENGASLPCNFASNLFGDTIIMTAPKLNDMIFSCPSQNIKANLPSYNYPPELLSFSQMQTICRGGVEFAVKRNECQIVKNLDNHPKQLFGEHILLSMQKAGEKEGALVRSKEAARLRAEQSGMSIEINLSERERRIIERLNRDE
jgi:hypothetical protein